jgi:hypothetical protein
MAYTPQRFRVVRNIREKARVEGVGACMAIRRSLLTALGGFDEELGAGAQLYSAEDTDIAVRALLAGFYVCETPDAAVYHYWFAAGMSEPRGSRLHGRNGARTRRCFAWVTAGYSTDRRIGLALAGQASSRGPETSASTIGSASFVLVGFRAGLRLLWMEGHFIPPVDGGHERKRFLTFRSWAHAPRVL